MKINFFTCIVYASTINICLSHQAILNKILNALVIIGQANELITRNLANYNIPRIMTLIITVIQYISGLIFQSKFNPRQKLPPTFFGYKINK